MSVEGVLLACFLVFCSRMTANQAILFVRDKRPNSIQTRGQLQCVRQFVQFLVPLRSVFSCAKPYVRPVTLDEYLVRQKHTLHGYEARQLRNVPKLIQLVCKLLPDIADNREIITEEILDVPEMSEEMEEEVENAIHKYRQLSRRYDHLKGLGNMPQCLPKLPSFCSDQYAQKSLSFSDTDIQRLATKLDMVDNPLEVLANMHRQSSSQNTLSDLPFAMLPGKRSPVLQSPTGSVWDIKSQMDKQGSPLLSKQNRSSSFKEKLQNGTGQSEVSSDSEWSERSEVPIITVQTELTLESRHLLLAQALALDLETDGQEDHRDTLAAWQVKWAL